MKKLEEIQNEVAKEHGWDSYEIVLEYFHEGIISKYAFLDIMDDLVHEVAKQALINASEGFYDDYRDIILNESNIPVL